MFNSIGEGLFDCNHSGTEVLLTNSESSPEPSPASSLNDIIENIHKLTVLKLESTLFVVFHIIDSLSHNKNEILRCSNSIFGVHRIQIEAVNMQDDVHLSIDVSILKVAIDPAWAKKFSSYVIHS